jgi:hypothetical protein
MMIGPAMAPLPAPAMLMEKIQSVQVTHSDEGRSGFQIVFEMGRSGMADLVDYPLQLNPLVRAFNRVVLIITFNAVPNLLMDGIITNFQFAPSNEAGKTTLTVTGEDVSVMLDMTEKTAEYPAMPEMAIVPLILAQYAQYGLVPMIVPPASAGVPNPLEEIPVQHDTDLKYINKLAERFSYVFYVIPGPAPLMNTAYWGPPVRVGVPQRALSFNMGAMTNVSSLSFQNNALAPTLISGKVQDEMLGEMPVETFVSTRVPLTSQPSILFNQPNVRTTLLTGNHSDGRRAYAQAQAMTDKSTDEVVTANGELDATRYGAVLQPRALVGVRGVGFSYDGLYYVKSVTHDIKLGAYKQSFTLTRDGVGAISPGVIP